MRGFFHLEELDNLGKTGKKELAFQKQLIRGTASLKKGDLWKI
jgi:hypothetical protein